jgi:hypothetical protein
MLSVEGCIALPSGSVGGMSRSFLGTEKKEVCIYIYMCQVQTGIALPCPGRSSYLLSAAGRSSCCIHGARTGWVIWVFGIVAGCCSG